MVRNVKIVKMLGYYVVISSLQVWSGMLRYSGLLNCQYGWDCKDGYKC